MRREKYIRFGGPDGGDGGKGGDIFIQGDSKLSSLLDLRVHPHQKAGNGAPGMGDQKTGRSGKSKIIRVPLGTTVINDETDEIHLDILDGETHPILRGGRGGLGNMRFRSSTNQAPRYAQPGEEGQEMCIRLELKLIAYVGLVGFPNAGKSTLISVISNARPKIADYPFTTIMPNLGVVQAGDFSTFVVADIPGIIKDAHLGAGLGDQFLRHIRRTSVLAFLIDCSFIAEHTPVDAYKILINELDSYSADLIFKKRIIFLSKIDAMDDSMELSSVMNVLTAMGEEAHAISSVTGKGLDKLVYRLSEIVETEKSMLASNESDTTPE